MAHPTVSTPLRGFSVPNLSASVERFVLRVVTSRAEQARDLVSQNDALAGRLTRSLQRRRIPAHPTLSWLVGAQLALWNTVDQLEAHSDRQLADIQIPRDLVKAVATLAAYGWPRQETVPAIAEAVAAPGETLVSRLRRRFFPTEAELEEAYLSGATDINDLEFRMREWDRRHAGPTALRSLA
jgi:hypothetical protein